MSKNYFQHSTNYKTINGLSNLTSFQSLNQSLLPSADSTYDIGSGTFKWRQGFFNTVAATGGVSTFSNISVTDQLIAENLAVNDTLSFVTLSGSTLKVGELTATDGDIDGKISLQSPIDGSTTNMEISKMYVDEIHPAVGNTETTFTDNVIINGDLDVLGTLSYTLPPAPSAEFGDLGDTVTGDLVTDPTQYTGGVANSNLQPPYERVLSAPTINATQWISTPFITLMGRAQTDRLNVTSTLVPSSNTDYNGTAFWNEGGSIVEGKSYFKGAVDVTGASTLSTLTTSGLSTLNSLSVTGNVAVGGTLGVTGATTLTSLTSGNTSITGTLGVSGAATVSSLTSGTTALGNTSITGTLGVNGTSTVNDIQTNTLSVVGDGTTTANKRYATLAKGISDPNFLLISAQGSSGTTNGVNVTRLGLAYNTTDNAMIRFHRGGTDTGGYISFGTGNDTTAMTIFGDQKVTLADTTESTSTSTGSFQLAGGMGCAKNISAATMLCNGNLTIGGNITSSDNDIRMTTASGNNYIRCVDNDYNYFVGSNNFTKTGAATSTTSGPNKFDGGIACNNTSYFTDVVVTGAATMSTFYQPYDDGNQLTNNGTTLTASYFKPTAVFVIFPTGSGQTVKLPARTDILSANSGLSTSNGFVMFLATSTDVTLNGNTGTTIAYPQSGSLSMTALKLYMCVVTPSTAFGGTVYFSFISGV